MTSSPPGCSSKKSEIVKLHLEGVKQVVVEDLAAALEHNIALEELRVSRGGKEDVTWQVQEITGHSGTAHVAITDGHG